MNKKKTNIIVWILNFLCIVSVCVLYFSSDYLSSYMMSGSDATVSVFNNPIIDVFFNNLQLICSAFCIFTGIINIICAIENRKNKKICFWQLAFAIYQIWLAVNFIFWDISDSNVIKYGSLILYKILPIILAVINIILIKKNKPKLIQVISYCAVIVLTLVNIIEPFWRIIILIMQLIYICMQDKNVNEGKFRKTINVILYYILYSLIVIVFLATILFSLLYTKINDTDWENQLTEIYGDLITLKGINKKSVLIPVENEGKYGFIDINGKEKINCQYDMVSYFVDAEINGKKYYFALAKNNNNYYLISKSNEKLDISNNKYINTLYNDLFDATSKMFNNEDENGKMGILQSNTFILESFLKDNINIEGQQTAELDEDIIKYVDLKEKDDMLYYDNKNYTMILEPLQNENEFEDEDEYEYDEEYEESEDYNFKVTIKKSDGSESSYIVNFPYYSDYENSIGVYSDGSIAFENVEENTQGWFNSDGDKVTMPMEFSIETILEDKIVLKKVDNETLDVTYYIVDKEGKLILKTRRFFIYKNMYLMQNQDGKMMLYDKNLNEMSKAYDKIIASEQVDMFDN